MFSITAIFDFVKPSPDLGGGFFVSELDTYGPHESWVVKASISRGAAYDPVDALVNAPHNTVLLNGQYHILGTAWLKPTHAPNAKRGKVLVALHGPDSDSFALEKKYDKGEDNAELHLMEQKIRKSKDAAAKRHFAQHPKNVKRRAHIIPVIVPTAWIGWIIHRSDQMSRSKISM